MMFLLMAPYLTICSWMVVAQEIALIHVALGP